MEVRKRGRKISGESGRSGLVVGMREDDGGARRKRETYGRIASDAG